MLFYSEGSTLGTCALIGFGSLCFNLGFSSMPQEKPTWLQFKQCGRCSVGGTSIVG